MKDRRVRDLPRYVDRLLRSGWLPDPGECVEVHVLHDGHCGHWHGAPCNCEPEFRMVEREEQCRES